jgi:hypothetical protein
VRFNALADALAVDTLRDSELRHRGTILATLPAGGPGRMAVSSEGEGAVAMGGDGAMRTASRNVLAVAAILASIAVLSALLH